MSKDATVDIKGPPEASLLSRRRWVLPVAGVGLLLLGLGIGLAIGLPLALNNKRNKPTAVDLTSEDSVLNLKGTTRTYYLAADPIDWDFAPAGKNLCTGKPFDEEAQLYTKKGIGSKYKKAVYRQYTDESFKVHGWSLPLPEGFTSAAMPCQQFLRQQSSSLITLAHCTH